MSTQDPRQRALIRDGRAITRRHAETGSRPPTFTDEDVYDLARGTSAEVNRISAGEPDLPADLLEEIRRISALD